MFFQTVVPNKKKVKVCRQMSGDQHIFFCVQKMLETHTDLEQHECEYMITKYIFFWVSYPFNQCLKTRFQIILM